MAALGAAGCLGTGPKAPANWTIEIARAGAAAPAGGSGAGLPAVRVASVGVRPPYDGTRLAVLRPDGSIAFDSFNVFAAPPAQILRGTVQDALEAAGAQTVAANSQAQAAASVEAVVTRIALDCREKDRRDAVVELTLALVEGRRVKASAKGEGRAGTDGGDYSAAFSRAFASAMEAAVQKLAGGGKR